MMNELVAQRAYRILKRLTRYQSVYHSQRPIPDNLRGIALHNGETIIGVYQNIPGEDHEIIVITDLGLHILSDVNWEYIGYDQIETVETPSRKEDIEGLTMRLASGKEIWLPVKGRDSRFKDVFQFLHFLDRVIKDIRSIS